MIQRLRAHPIFHHLPIALVVLVAGALLNCTPRVEVAVPDEPITINLNVKIDHEVRVKVEKDLDNVFTDQSGLF